MGTYTQKIHRELEKRTWRRPFLATLRQSANVYLSCQAANVSRVAVYSYRHKSEKFAREWDNAIEEAVDHLEAVARQRALTTSDLLMIFLLKAHRPAKYREVQRLEHTGPGGGPVVLSFAELVKLAREEQKALPEPGG